jgi:hypothetical protein
LYQESIALLVNGEKCETGDTFAKLTLVLLWKLKLLITQPLLAKNAIVALLVTVTFPTI